MRKAYYAYEKYNKEKWGKYNEASTTIWDADWYNMWDTVDHSKYEPRTEQTLIHVQVISSIR